MAIIEELREKFIAQYPQYDCEKQYICKRPDEFNTKAYQFYEMCEERKGEVAFGYYEFNENNSEPPAILEPLYKQYRENPDNRRFGISYAINSNYDAFILTVVFYRRHQWTEEELYDKIDHNDLQTLLALEKLFARQTAEELASRNTIEHNGKGLNAYDAKILTQWWFDGSDRNGNAKMGIKTYLKQVRSARERLKKGERGVPFPENPMSIKQMELIRKILRKYRKQLLEIVNN